MIIKEGFISEPTISLLTGSKGYLRHLFVVCQKQVKPSKQVWTNLTQYKALTAHTKKGKVPRKQLSNELDIKPLVSD